MHSALKALTAIALISAIGACAPPINAGGDEALCASGQVISCKCEGGGAGEKVCSSASKFGACVCPDGGALDAGGGSKPDAITGGDTIAPKKPDAIVIGDTVDAAANDANATLDTASEDTAKPVDLTAEVTTVAGSGNAGNDDGPALEASFHRPVAVAVLNGTVYVVDYQGNRIRGYKDGVVTTVAGNLYGFKDETGTAASFRHPSGLTVDKNVLVIADRDNHAIRRFDTATGKVTTLAGSEKGFKDGKGTTAKFSAPEGVAIAENGRTYVADTQNNRLRQVLPNGYVQTLTSGGAGFSDGTGPNTKFAFPAGLAARGKHIYIADAVNHAIRDYNYGNGKTVTLAGNKILGSADGKGKDARFNFPRSVAVDSKGVLFVCDTGGHRLRRIATDGTVTTLSGNSPGHTDGPAEAALFSKPWGIATGADGVLWIADSANRRLRKLHMVAVGN